MAGLSFFFRFEQQAVRSQFCLWDARLVLEAPIACKGWDPEEVSGSQTALSTSEGMLPVLNPPPPVSLSHIWLEA